MRNSLRLLALAGALSLTAGTVSAQTRTRPTQEEMDARREQAKAAAEARKAQQPARGDVTKEQMEARREAAKAAAEARRAAAGGATRPETRPTTRPTTTPRPPRGDGPGNARADYQSLRSSLLADVKAGTLDRAAAEAQLKAWRDSHSGGR